MRVIDFEETRQKLGNRRFENLLLTEKDLHQWKYAEFPLNEFTEQDRRDLLAKDWEVVSETDEFIRMRKAVPVSKSLISRMVAEIKLKAQTENYYEQEREQAHIDLDRKSRRENRLRK